MPTETSDAEVNSFSRMKNPQLGHAYSPHMLTFEWSNGRWHNPVIKPFEAIQLAPGASCLHYGVECFEGMKAFRNENGAIYLFRPLDHLRRLKQSAARICLPDFNEIELLQCIEKLVALDSDWVPRTVGHALYIRPTFIATGTTIGVHESHHALLYVICSPCMPYHGNGISLLSVDLFNRAYPKGTGSYKIGGNYAPCLLYLREARRAGFDQNLWLFEGNITEAGTTNVFVHWIDKAGLETISTPPANGLILPGITRDSVIEIVEAYFNIPIIEEQIPIKDLILAIKQYRVKSFFATGTAASIVPITKIGYNNEEYVIPCSSPIAKRICELLGQIQTGQIDFNHWAYKLRNH